MKVIKKKKFMLELQMFSANPFSCIQYCFLQWQEESTGDFKPNRFWESLRITGEFHHNCKPLNRYINIYTFIYLFICIYPTKWVSNIVQLQYKGNNICLLYQKKIIKTNIYLHFHTFRQICSTSELKTIPINSTIALIFKFCILWHFSRACKRDFF